MDDARLAVYFLRRRVPIGIDRHGEGVAIRLDAARYRIAVLAIHRFGKRLDIVHLLRLIGGPPIALVRNVHPMSTRRASIHGVRGDSPTSFEQRRCVGKGQ